LGGIFVKIGIKTQNISKKRLKFVAEIFLADLRDWKKPGWNHSFGYRPLMTNLLSARQKACQKPAQLSYLLFAPDDPISCFEN
jgi:hypothetical protein